MMKILLLSMGIIISMGLKAQTAEDIVNAFFTALNAKDAKVLEQLTVDDMQLHTLILGENSQTSSTTKAKFIEGISAISAEVKIEERIFNIRSLSTSHLAQFQVPYEFYINGEFSHKGINVLTLLRTKLGWRVSYIADTREK